MCPSHHRLIRDRIRAAQEPGAVAATRLPLRERNATRLHLRVLGAVLDLTADRALADLSVREIADAVEVSSGTFFNHFPSKEAVLLYYMRLWALAATASARAAAAAGTAEDGLRAVFAYTADEIEAHPRVMLEIITLVAQATAPPQAASISRAERMLAFHDLPDAAAPEPAGLGGLVAELVALARERGELPLTVVDEALATRLLMGLFYGLPLATRTAGPWALRSAYDEGLTVLLDALRLSR